MKKIQKPVGQNVQQARMLQQNRQKQLQTDVSKAKTTNATTLGRQTNRTADDKKAETPKEKVTITTTRPEEQKETKTAQQDAPKVENQIDSQPAAPREKTSEDLQQDFVNSFAENLDDKAMQEIAKKSSESVVEITQNSGVAPKPEAVLAAHTQNYAKQILNRKMPNASIAEIREAAKSDPEIAKAVKLMDTTSAYVKSLKAEAPKGGENGQASQTVAPGDSDLGGAPQTGPQAGVDPFAARRAAMGDQQQPPGDGGGGDSDQTGPPGEGGGPQNPYHLSPEKQAEMMAQNHQTMMEVQKIYTQMFADMQKAAAERHQIMQETSIAINDIMMSIYHKRQASFAKHNAAVLAMLTDSWG